ncbi:MAG: adenosyl cobinamide kinase/adenosyl cobinamide phosphate guanylyltransferase, partial [Clostridiales bacterium]|nr:adenosyl cobinamide kinase/adenosyl cobinamide phosphate guanylyltransferase [Clostridiales bacterium]
MGNLILVTGGARSGKSSFAEDMVKALGDNIVYIATSIPFDDEMKLRVKLHREQRPSHWDTVEAYKNINKNLEGKLDSKSAVMLDCITVMVTNLMFEKCPDFEKITTEDIVQIEDYVRLQIDLLISTVKESPIPFVIVTNEIGMGIVPEHKSSRVFRDVAGRANQMLAKEADDVYFCV